MNKIKIDSYMHGVHLIGHGGFDKLVYRDDLPIPNPNENEVLIQVSAAGVNNTDINTRLGWYSKKIIQETNQGGDKGFQELENDSGSWSGEGLAFPIIQGADVCGHIVKVGKSIDDSRIGERVIVRTMQNNYLGMKTMGSEIHGGFAQYTCVDSNEAFLINSNWTDTELASIPCSYSTAEGMLQKASAGKENILITGASGGVGTAAIQLANLRGANVIAQCSKEKAEDLKKIGAHKTIDRNDSLIQSLGKNSIDLVVDLVGGIQWPQILETLKSGGRYVVSGAIAGPIVELDLRTLYLKDLTFYGSTFNHVNVFYDLINYIERNKIKPIIARTFSLKDIKLAQEMFLEKKFVGKIVLVP
jgi:NADPH:quinone reductase-like Zn-dependent oxidoreductase